MIIAHMVAGGVDVSVEADDQQRITGVVVSAPNGSRHACKIGIGGRGFTIPASEIAGQKTIPAPNGNWRLGDPATFSLE